MDKNHVTMEVCPICRKSTGAILLDQRLRKRFEMHTVNPTHVCKACRKKYLKKGVMLIDPTTGALVVIKDEAFKRIFNKPIPKQKIAFTDAEVLGKLQGKLKKVL